MTGKIVLVGRTADLVARSGKSLLNTRPAASEDIPALAEAIAGEPALRLRGLMAIPEPQADPAERDRQYAQWNKAVERTYDWL